MLNKIYHNIFKEILKEQTDIQNRIGLVAGNMSPAHRGHFHLIEEASKENEKVVLFVSLKGREDIREGVMKNVWELVLKKYLPENVVVNYCIPPFPPQPIRAVYEEIGKVEEAIKIGAVKKENAPTFNIYSDPKDMKKNYGEESFSKYFPILLRLNKIIKTSIERAGEYDIRGEQMREWLETNREDRFIGYLPAKIAPEDKEKIWNMLKGNKIKEQVVVEGGASRHIQHPYEDFSLTFKSLKDMIGKLLTAKIENDGVISEKIDGYNFFISSYNGQLVWARNKATLSSPSGLRELEKHFNVREPNVKGGFVDAFLSLSEAIKDLDLLKLFENMKYWINLEIVCPQSKNVINYEGHTIVFHNMIQFNKEEKKIGKLPEYEKRRFEEFVSSVEKQQRAARKNKFKFSGPIIVNLKQMADENFKTGIANEIKNIQLKFKLGDVNTIGDYIKKCFLPYIKKYVIDNNDAERIANRLAYDDKSIINANEIKKKYPGLAQMISNRDKMYHEFISPIEYIFFDVGTKLLSALKSALVLNPEKEIIRIGKEVDDAIKLIKNDKQLPPDKAERIQRAIKKIQRIEGQKGVALEGIVFFHNKNQYKITGAFSAINQILGFYKYNR